MLEGGFDAMEEAQQEKGGRDDILFYGLIFKESITVLGKVKLHLAEETVGVKKPVRAGPGGAHF